MNLIYGRLYVYNAAKKKHCSLGNAFLRICAFSNFLMLVFMTGLV